MSFNTLLFSPAKINLNLIISGKRSDGFHELDTLMVRTDLCDTIQLSLTPANQPAISLTCTDPALPTDSRNLAVQAAELYQNQIKQFFQLGIFLEKKIPAGGGLGGGSSNAATILKGFNQLMNHSLSSSKLLELAGKLGSDVPFFLSESPAARCRGRGEIIEPMEMASDWPRRAILINPGFGVPTPWAYRAYSSLPENKKQGETGPSFTWGTLRNDLEPAVFQKYLLLPEIKNWLLIQPGVLAALMSGSGSTLFGLLEETTNFPQLELEFRKMFGTTAFVADVKFG